MVGFTSVVRAIPLNIRKSRSTLSPSPLLIGLPLTTSPPSSSLQYSSLPRPDHHHRTLLALLHHLLLYEKPLHFTTTGRSSESNRSYTTATL